MDNIQTIRLVYAPIFLSEKEYIKTFLEFIGFQILEEPFQSNEEMVDILRKAASDYDLDIWLNLKTLFYNDDEYISTAYCSRAKNVIALDYYFSETKDFQEYSVSTFSKKSRKSDEIRENVENKEELRKRVLEKLVEQLWYRDSEKQAEIKLVTNLYVKHNIFVCMQALPGLSIAGIIGEDCRWNFGGYVHPTEFWKFCIKGFADFFNELQLVNESLKTVYALYAYTYAAIIYIRLNKATKFIYHKEVTINFNFDYDSILSLIKRTIGIDENFVEIWCLAILNSFREFDKKFEIREYLNFILNNLQGKVLNSKFTSKFALMLGIYYTYIGGDIDISYSYYLLALKLNKNNIQANFMLANIYHAVARRYSEAEYYLRKVLDLLCSSLNKNNALINIGTTDYEMLFKTCIWLAKLSYAKKTYKSRQETLEFINSAITVYRLYQDASWIGRIVDDEPIWNVLKEHYKNGTPTHKFYGVLYRWAQKYPYNVHLQNTIKAIMPKQFDKTPYI